MKYTECIYENNGICILGDKCNLTNGDKCGAYTTDDENKEPKLTYDD